MHDTRDPLNLRSLPETDPPRDVWAEIAARSEPRPRRPWLMALAAALVVGLASVLLVNPADDPTQPEIDRWITYSQVLENQLRTVRDRTSVYRGHEAVALAELEDMVAEIDRDLAHADAGAERLQLWQQRALVLDDLLSVYAMAGSPGRSDTEPTPIVTRLPVALVSN